MRKLLLVEDDRIIANIYQRKFTLDGFDVRVCENGREAINRFDDFHPDVVILDLNLPVLNGFEVLKHIRLRQPDLPVVVFSNAYQPQMIQQAWQDGASAVLMKANTNPRKMADTLRELLPPEAPSQPPPASPPPPRPRPLRVCQSFSTDSAVCTPNS
jgi:CheY-like chemotaxis protein